MGFEPDIEIDNLPNEVVRGRDAQLEKAIEVVLGMLKPAGQTQPN